MLKCLLNLLLLIVIPSLLIIIAVFLDNWAIINFIGVYSMTIVVGFIKLFIIVIEVFIMEELAIK